MKAHVKHKMPSNKSMLVSWALIGLVVLLQGCASQIQKDFDHSRSSIKAASVATNGKRTAKRVLPSTHVRSGVVIKGSLNWIPGEPKTTTPLRLRSTVQQAGANNKAAPSNNKLIVAEVAVVYFDSGKYQFDLSESTALARLDNKPTYAVIGYADPRGSAADNLLLSFRRADAVAKWLRRHGYRVGEILARGEECASNHPSMFQMDRRVVVVPLDRAILFEKECPSPPNSSPKTGLDRDVK